MAVVRVAGTDMNGDTFDNVYKIPGDSDGDGIADNYEKQFCTQFPEDERLTCLNPDEDDDLGPEPESAMGDGIAARDEYRGFRASGEYIRTDPRVKDLFLNLVTEPGGVIETNFDTDLTPLFANMENYSTGLRVHRINSNEWIDHFASYSSATRVLLDQGAVPAEDRQITQNALVPPAGNPVKGVRLIECLDLSQYSPLGLTIKKAPPDGLEKDYGNAVIFTQRIAHHYNNKFDLGESRQLQYYSFENGRWSTKWTGEGAPTEDDKSFILKKGLAFYAAHEACGHGLDLTSTQEGTKRNPVGYHHVAGTGTDIDIAIVHKVDKKSGGYNKFYIPKSFGISDKRDMRILSIQ